MRKITLPLLIIAPATMALAQQPAADSARPVPGSTTVLGAVYDSIRGRPMAGAQVQVDAGGPAAFADEDGHFRIENVSPGQHQLWVSHPILDTIGIALRTPPAVFRVGETREYDVATPSPESLVAMLCAPAWRTRGPAALLGRVHEADTGQPATGAKVSLVWYEMEIASGVRKVPRVREATVAVNGTYRICGLPAQLDGKVQVLRGALTSGEIAISFGDSPLYLRSMSIASPSSVVSVTVPSAQGDSAPPRTITTVIGTARLTGRVVNTAGTPLPNARVQLEGTTRAAPTRDNGEFALDSLPAGTQSVSVRLLGYAPIEQAVDLAPHETRNVTLQLSQFVPVLGEIRVTAQRERALDAVGFARRKRSGMGYYLDDKQINHDAQNFSDALRMVPGLRIVPMGMGRQAITSQRSPNGCTLFWIDGTMWQQMEPGDVDDFVKPYELAAIEVYSGTSAPAEFQGPGGGSCTTVVAWTYNRLDRKK